MSNTPMRRLDAILWWLGAALLIVAAIRMVPWFIDSWASDPYFGHGWAVMLWGLGVALFRFLTGLATVHESAAAGKVPPSGRGGRHRIEALLLPGGSLAMFAGFALDIASLKAVGLLLAAFGLLRWRLGAARFRPLAAPLYFTLLSIPWPWGIVQMVALPMQEASASLARFTLDLGGLPVLQHGIVLDTGRFKLVVEEACSGLRSFVALLTVAIYLLGTGWGNRRQRWLLPFVALAVILCGNALRLGSGLLIGHFANPHWAMLWVEDISSFLLILAEAAVLLIWLDRPASANTPSRLRAADIPALLRRCDLRLAAGRPSAGQYSGIALLLLAVGSLSIPAQTTRVSLPAWPIPPGWTEVHGAVVDDSIRQIETSMQRGAIVRVVRVRSQREPDMPVDGQMIISSGGPGRDVDDPRYCYRSKGWRMLFEGHRALPETAGHQGPVVNEIIEQLPHSGVTRLDWFAYRVGHRWVDSYLDLRLHQVLGRAMRRLDNIAVVHVSTPLRQNADRESEIRAARRRLTALWKTMPLH